MKLAETMEMAYPRKYLEHIIIGLEDPLRFRFPARTAPAFPARGSQSARQNSTAAPEPENRTGSFKFYYDLLYDYPFGGVEVQNMRTMMDLIAEEYGVQPARSPQDLVDWLQRFHSRLAERLHNGQAVLVLVPD